MIGHAFFKAGVGAGNRWRKRTARSRPRRIQSPVMHRSEGAIRRGSPRRGRSLAPIAILPLRSLLVLLFILAPLFAILLAISHFHMMSSEPIGIKGWLDGFRP